MLVVILGRLDHRAGDAVQCLFVEECVVAALVEIEPEVATPLTPDVVLTEGPVDVAVGTLVPPAFEIVIRVYRATWHPLCKQRPPIGNK